jgi:hypothetical protein
VGVVDCMAALPADGGGEQVRPGKALAEQEGDQDPTLRLIPSRTGASDWNQTAVQAAAMDRESTDPAKRGHA